MSSGGASGAGAPSTIGSAGGGPPSGSPVLGLPEQWLMHDGSGSIFADATPNDNTITATDITWGTGTGVTSPTFNGTTSTGVAAQTPITNFDGTLPFSVSVWFNTSSSGTQILAGTTVTSDSYKGWSIYFSVDQVGFLLINTVSTNGINILAGGGLVTGTVYNLIVTYDGSQTAAGAKFYLNGSLIVASTQEDNLTSSAASGVPLQVGSSSDGVDYFDGSMSNLQVFSGVLTSGQIAAIQTAGP